MRPGKGYLKWREAGLSWGGVEGADPLQGGAFAEAWNVLHHRFGGGCRATHIRQNPSCVELNHRNFLAS